MANNAIAKLSRIRTALEAAKSLDEIIDIRDQAVAVTTYAKAIGLSVQNVNAAVEVKLLAERKAGSLLKGMGLRERRQSNLKQNTPKSHDGTSVELQGLGIDKKQSHRWQKLSAIPDDTFIEILRLINDAHAELTTAGLMRQWSTLSKPSNGAPLSGGDSLPAALERLHRAIVRIYGEWPKQGRDKLAAKLRAYADELESTGGLAL